MKKLDDLLASVGTSVSDGSLRTTDEETESSSVKKTPVLTLQIRQKTGIRINIPWVTYKGAVLYGEARATEVFLELLFYDFNVLIFGRNLLEVMNFVQGEAVADLSEATVPDGESLPFYISRILVIQGGTGESLFLDDREDRRELSAFLAKNPGLRLRRPEALESTSSLIMPEVFPGELELAGHPRTVELQREALQHARGTKERREAQEEERGVDMRKVHH